METKQMDKVLINKRILSPIKDARSMQGLNPDSDYCLVRLKCKQKLTKIRNDKYKKGRNRTEKNWMIQVSLRNIQKKL
jgi:hypothetical protein